MDVSRYVFDVGDTVTGWGEIVQDDDGIWFDPPHATTLVWTDRPEPRSDLAIRLIGVDPRAVTTGIADGHGPGWATITGVWRGDVIEVLSQSAVRPAHVPLESGPRWTIPPCPAPIGGWPASPINDELEELSESDEVAALVIFHPNPGTTVIVVAASDVDAVEIEFRSRYGNSLCVVPSRWSKQQLETVRGVLHDHWGDWSLSSWAVEADDRVQSTVEVSLLRVPPDMAAWAAGLPEGILRINAALTRA